MGILALGSFFSLLELPSFRGTYTPAFLANFIIAGTAYAIAVHRLGKDRLQVNQIWGFAIILRLILLFTTPSLSDDVYRYIWDGHLLNQGVNPYALPVNSPLLDTFTIPLRALVNHDWMASPYLPAAQGVFWLVSRIGAYNGVYDAAQSVLAFQVSATVFDLLTGWLVMDLLPRLGLRRSNVLLYLWNPLLIVEFAHGAHIDSLIIMLVMLALWLVVCYRKNVCSAILLAAATLTKPLPVLLVPILFRRWRWKGIWVYLGLIFGVLALFAIDAGWGLTGELNGTGIFGATRIYLQYWNYNSGIYHWLEVAFSGYQTAGAVPVEIVGETPILLAKAITTGLLGLVVLFTAWQVWRKERNSLDLLRLALIPMGAYLLLTPTVHPWYLTLIIPFLPFLQPQKGESTSYRAFIWPWIYFSIAVAFSYLTYYDPANFREYAQVRALEYVPTYLLLGLAILYKYVLSKKTQIPNV